MSGCVSSPEVLKTFLLGEVIRKNIYIKTRSWCAPRQAEVKKAACKLPVSSQWYNNAPLGTLVIKEEQPVLHRAQPAGAFKHGEFKNSPCYWTPGLTQWKLSAEDKFSWSISVMLFGKNREEPNASFRMIFCIHFSSCRISCILIFTLHFMRK